MKDLKFKKDVKVLIKVIGDLKKLPQNDLVKHMIVLHEQALNIVENMDRKNPLKMLSDKIKLMALHEAIKQLSIPQPSMN